LIPPEIAGCKSLKAAPRQWGRRIHGLFTA
jgi:hypothetical protein